LRIVVLSCMSRLLRPNTKYSVATDSHNFTEFPVIFTEFYFSQYSVTHTVLCRPRGSEEGEINVFFLFLFLFLFVFYLIHYCRIWWFLVREGKDPPPSSIF